MPLIDISAEDATATRKANPFATWGARREVNRVEPIAKPAFDVNFQFEPGEPIFTVGSCFARNVETELIKRGFRVPIRDIFRHPEFAGLEVGSINNFGTPSIANEFDWAFGEKSFDLNEHIAELGDGKFVDLHLIPSIRPSTFEIVSARREAILQAYRLAAECRIIIMTLGLVEVWFDRSTGYYLNATPRPSLIRREPERFRLHVLSYEETLGHLERSIALLKRVGRADLQVLLTVSPVPLMATHRPADVMVANTYSKAVLRTVAETVVLKNDFVSYFPSYESVSLSDRRIAWHDDFVHVTNDIVAVQIGRMVNAFAGVAVDASSDDARSAQELAQEAQQVRQVSSEAASAFFTKHASVGLLNGDFALEHAGFLGDAGDVEAALSILHDAPLEEERRALPASKLLLKAGRPKDAFGRMDAVIHAGAKSYGMWNGLMLAALATGDTELVLATLARWGRAAPTRAARANATVGRWLFEKGDLERARSFLEVSVALDGEDATAALHLAECFVATGRLDEARKVYARIHPDKPSEHLRFQRLGYLSISASPNPVSPTA